MEKKLQWIFIYIYIFIYWVVFLTIYLKNDGFKLSNSKNGRT